MWANEIEIAEFIENDIDAVFEIQKAAYKPLFEKYRDDDTSPYTESRETVLRKNTRPGTKGYVIKTGGKLVGSVRIDIDTESGSGRVAALAVHPEYQCRGIAKQALMQIEEMHSGIKNWVLDTILQEEGNCRLYEKLGYIRTGKTEDINERMTLVFYEKTKH